jgi:hypothetical protein
LLRINQNLKNFFAPSYIRVSVNDRYGDHIWGQYGFSDAFNVDQDWYDQDVVGIDVGITLVMLQNHKDELIWRLFMQGLSIQTAVERAGFH